MIKRLFKLLYVFALIGITLYIPIYIYYKIAINLGMDRIVENSYRAKCKSNNEYVILQGSKEPYEFNSFVLNTAELETKKDLNFYCKYYNEVQPYITGYDGTYKGNTNFFDFKESVIKNVNSYPELYNLELLKKEIHYDYIYGAFIAAFVFALIMFIALQFLRICYVYIVFGKVIWHPFKLVK
jgi:hypothetical protein